MSIIDRRRYDKNTRIKIAKMLADGFIHNQICLELKMGKSTLSYHIAVLHGVSDTYTDGGIVGWALRTGYIK